MTEGRPNVHALGLVPDVVPIETLAGLLGVPVALLIDAVVRGELAVVVPWSLTRFEIQPFPQVTITGADGSTFPAAEKVPLFDLYPGETPAFYVAVATIEGSSDVLYRVLRGERVTLLAGIHRSAQGAAMDNPAPVGVGLGDLFVTREEIERRGWLGPAGLAPAPRPPYQFGKAMTRLQLGGFARAFQGEQVDGDATGEATESVDSETSSRDTGQSGRATERNCFAVLELLMRYFAAKMEMKEVFGTEAKPLRGPILKHAVDALDDGAAVPGLSDTELGRIHQRAQEVFAAVHRKMKARKPAT